MKRREGKKTQHIFQKKKEKRMLRTKEMVSMPFLCSCELTSKLGIAHCMIEDPHNRKTIWVS